MLTETGVIGSVRDAVTGIPVRKATVLVAGLSYAVTKNLALFKLILPVGEYRLRFASDGYEEVVRQVTIGTKQRIDLGIVTLLRKGDTRVIQTASLEIPFSSDVSTGNSITGKSRSAFFF